MMKPHDTTQTKNLILAVAFSLVIMLGFELLGFGSSAHKQMEAQNARVSATEVVAQPALATAVSATEIKQAEVAADAEVSKPVMLENAKVKVVYDVRGGKVAGWTLKTYTQNGGDTLGYNQLHLAGDHAEYAESGWLGSGIETPGVATMWKVVESSPARAVLSWNNSTGQTFTRELTLKDDFTLLVDDTVTNKAELPVSLTPYAQVHRAGGELGKEHGTWVSYHGPMGVTRTGPETLTSEFGFAKLAEGKMFTPVSAEGGWWGISSHYFLTAWVPDGWGPSTRDFRKNDIDGQTVFTASLQGGVQVVAPQGHGSMRTMLYAGPKQEDALLAAGHDLERSIDWGWFSALARPFYRLLLWFHGLSGSWALAIVAMTLLLKLATFPLANKSYHAMAKMKKLQPKMEAMKERYKDDQQALAVEMMKLYRDHKVNPLSGCWPMLIQIPIFFAMYKVVLLSFEFRHATPGLWPLNLWIHDLSMSDPLFVLPILMGLSMFVQQWLNPPPADPSQAMVFKWMPVIFTVMFLWFPAALVWYWLINNVFSVAQQAYIMREDKAI